MNSKQLIRWVLFVVLGLPVQAIVYLVYPLIWLYWRFVIYKKPEGDKQVVAHVFVNPIEGKKKNKYGLLDNVDDHGAFSMYGALTSQAFEWLTDGNDNLHRRLNEDGSYNRWQVSGDVLISYCFAATHTKPASDQIEIIAWKYLFNLGITSKDDKNNEDVSNRCNNFGVNYCPDSDSLKLGQPMAGPQFYTSSAIFALASQTSNVFKVVFWLHWLLLGGWYWCWMPVVYTKDRPLHYVRDMTMKALYVHKYVFGNRWWIRKPMEHITYELSNIRNDLWFAMMGLPPVHGLPESMDSFFSQKENCTSVLTDRMNGFLGHAVYDLANQGKILNDK